MNRLINLLFLAVIYSLVVACTQSKQDTTAFKDIRVCTELGHEFDRKDSSKWAGAPVYFLWPKETEVLNITFLDGDPIVQQKVVSAAKQWEEHCGILFNFDNSVSPHITVSFKHQGSWSFIGKSSMGQRPSMNFGWLDRTTPDEEYNRVVLHEFGHALGLIHEHQNPRDNPIKWNKALVYEYYMQPPNNWSKEEVDQNLFAKYDKVQTNGTTFDPESIMLYPVPKQFTLDGREFHGSNTLSDLDKEFIGKIYPRIK